MWTLMSGLPGGLSSLWNSPEAFLRRGLVTFKRLVVKWGETMRKRVVVSLMFPVVILAAMGLAQEPQEKSHDAVEAEIQRLLPLMREGGFIVMPDHLITRGGCSTTTADTSTACGNCASEA